MSNFRNIKEDLEIGVNSTLFEIVLNLSERNIIDGIKLLHVVYGIQYKFIARVMGISENSLNMAKKYDSFDGIVRKEKILNGISNIKMHYLVQGIKEDPADN